MRNEIEKFHHSVNVLVKAYLNNTLEHSNCRACAVGNLITGNGYDLKSTGWKNDAWLSLISERRGFPIPFAFDKKEAERQVYATGYTLEELDKIEYAFEKSPHGGTEESWMFNGLMAVVDVLSQIHGVDLSVKEEAKKLFVKA